MAVTSWIQGFLGTVCDAVVLVVLVMPAVSADTSNCISVCIVRSLRLLSFFFGGEKLGRTNQSWRQLTSSSPAPARSTTAGSLISHLACRQVSGIPS